MTHWPIVSSVHVYSITRVKPHNFYRAILCIRARPMPSCEVRLSRSCIVSKRLQIRPLLLWDANETVPNVLRGHESQWSWGPLTQISRSCYYSTLNIPETLPDRDSYSGTLTGTYTMPYTNVSFRMTLWLSELFISRRRHRASSLRQLSSLLFFVINFQYNKKTE